MKKLIYTIVLAAGISAAVFMSGPLQYVIPILCALGVWLAYELDHAQEMPEDYDDYYNDLVENSPHESCPACGRSYDEIDFDFQSCSKCGWDAEEQHYEHGLKTEPNEFDYFNGDADLMTGEWY